MSANPAPDVKPMPTTKVGRELLGLPRGLVDLHAFILAIEAEAVEPWRDITLRLRGRLRGVARHHPLCHETSLDERQGTDGCTCGLLKLMAEARALLADKPVGSDGLARMVPTITDDLDVVWEPADTRAMSEQGICTCGHYRWMHNEYGTTGRHNGPTTRKACENCDCWTYRKEAER